MGKELEVLTVWAVVSGLGGAVGVRVPWVRVARPSTAATRPCCTKEGEKRQNWSLSFVLSLIMPVTFLQ